MDRSKKVIFVSNCILNQNVVVNPLARSKGAYTDVVKTIMDYDIGIHQLSCPEFRHLGLSRKPMTKEEYDTLEYRELSRKISLDMIEIINEYLDNDYNIIGLIGINSSPSCGVRGQAGIMIESIKEITHINNIDLRMIDLPIDYWDGYKSISFIKQLKNFLEENIK